MSTNVQTLAPTSNVHGSAGDVAIMQMQLTMSLTDVYSTYVSTMLKQLMAALMGSLLSFGLSVVGGISSLIGTGVSGAKSLEKAGLHDKKYQGTKEKIGEPGNKDGVQIKLEKDDLLSQGLNGEREKYDELMQGQGNKDGDLESKKEDFRTTHKENVQFINDHYETKLGQLDTYAKVSEGLAQIGSIVARGGSDFSNSMSQMMNGRANATEQLMNSLLQTLMSIQSTQALPNQN